MQAFTDSIPFAFLPRYAVVIHSSLYKPCAHLNQTLSRLHSAAGMQPAQALSCSEGEQVEAQLLWGLMQVCVGLPPGSAPAAGCAGRNLQTNAGPAAGSAAAAAVVAGAGSPHLQENQGCQDDTRKAKRDPVEKIGPIHSGTHVCQWVEDSLTGFDKRGKLYSDRPRHSCWPDRLLTIR